MKTFKKQKLSWNRFLTDDLLAVVIVVVVVPFVVVIAVVDVVETKKNISFFYL
jgi:hypothetical protein